MTRRLIVEGRMSTYQSDQGCGGNVSSPDPVHCGMESVRLRDVAFIDALLRSRCSSAASSLSGNPLPFTSASSQLLHPSTSRALEVLRTNALVSMPASLRD